MTDKQLIHVATVGKPHGLLGIFFVKSFLDMDLACVKTIQGVGGEVMDITFKSAGKDNMYYGKWSDITDRNGSEALRGTKLYAQTDILPVIDEPDTFYHKDLIGLSIIGANDKVLGVVESVYNFGAQDIIEYVSEKGKPIMVPFTKAAILSVDEKQIHINEDFVVMDG
jgi:16S rRNA processing protein RimM